MIVNPYKFQAILLDKRKSDHTNQRIVVNNQYVKVVSSVELLETQIDDKLKFVGLLQISWMLYLD